MAGNSKRGKTVVEEEDELNPRSKSRTRKHYSRYAPRPRYRYELSPPLHHLRLLISNGGAICLLDLEQSKDKLPLINADYVPPLPIIASLNLMENHLPVLAGLFKVGSDVYMIGGHKLTQKQSPHLIEWPKRLKSTSRSRTIYRLSLAHADNKDSHNHNTALIITASKAQDTRMMKKLKSPKTWPIVEEIDGQIHVFDSAFHKWSSKPRRDWRFSHEVLNTKRKTGVDMDMDLPPVLNRALIESHLVLGKRIYARMEHGKHLVFDSETSKWEYIADPIHRPSPQFVRDILDNGASIITSCVGEFPPYYVVIGIFEHRSLHDSNYYYVNLNGVYAEAFIVRGATGEVVCRQPLPRFFQGPVQPNVLRGGKVIKVDEEGKTMCAILNAHALLNGCEYDSAGGYLFVYTFSVEILASAADIDERLNLEEFVRVFPKQRFVYKTNDRRQEEDKGIYDPDFTDFQAIQACFI